MGLNTFAYEFFFDTSLKQEACFLKSDFESKNIAG